MSDPLVVSITGASGAVYGVETLRALRALHIESILVLSHTARVTLRHELGMSQAEVQALADRTYEPHAFTAPIASGSFRTRGMIVVPCSIKTLSAIAHSYADTLIARAADVTLKEGRPLLLAVRETPLHVGHLRLMVQAAELGAVIFPPLPALYARPASIAEMVRQTVGRMLARLGIANDLHPVWGGDAYNSSRIT